MKKIRIVMLSLLLAIAADISADPYNGEMNVYDPTGFVIWFDSVSGDIDTAANHMTLNAAPFFGILFNIDSVKFFGPGNYVVPDSFGNPHSIRVGADQVGALFEIAWSFNKIPLVMVWDILPTGPNRGIFAIADSDNDGVPGQAMTLGPFPGFTLVIDNFEAVVDVGTPSAGVILNMNVPDGFIQECSAIGGSEVTVNAVASVFGGATLDYIEWTVDGNVTGNGDTISPFLALGTHEIGVTAYTTDGDSDTGSVTVDVQDTTRPTFDISFVDNRSTEVETASPGYVVLKLDATDICDDNPVVSKAIIDPVYTASNQSLIHINNGTGAVMLGASALRASASATDASGNTASSTAILNIEPVKN